MTSVELLKSEYKTPLAQVRGVFLCGNLATAVSVLGSIEQEEWGNGDVEIGDTNVQGDISLQF
jgi:hypothetical protein